MTDNATEATTAVDAKESVEERPASTQGVCVARRRVTSDKPNYPPERLAGLVPFSEGHDPRRAYRVAGATYREWLTTFNQDGPDGRAAYPEAKLQAIADDPNASSVKRAAARTCLGLSLEGTAKNGTPLYANDLDRLLDRTEGKPLQRVVTADATPQRDRTAIVEQLSALLERMPEVRAALAGQLEGANPPELPAKGDSGTGGDPPAAPCGGGE